MCSSWLICAALAWAFTTPPAEAANLSAMIGPEAAAALAAELTRLDGHDAAVTADGYTISDVAGEGRPIVGVVQRRGDHLFLVTRRGREYRLAGALARPRIAGPGYKIWALGTITGRAGDLVLTPRRLGVLAPPDRGYRGRYGDAAGSRR